MPDAMLIRILLFRANRITAYFNNGGTMENIAAMANSSAPWQERPGVHFFGLPEETPLGTAALRPSSRRRSKEALSDIRASEKAPFLRASKNLRAAFGFSENKRMASAVF